jgi:stage II sporulation protein M
MRVGSLYRQAWLYLLESKNAIGLVVALFACSIFIGFAFSSYFTYFDEVLRDIFDETEGLSAFALIVYIFANNFQSSLSGMLFGVVLGLFPLAATILNGTLLGYVLHLSWSVSGIQEFWRLLPHGVFELPAVFISLGLGIRLGMFVFEKQRLQALAYRLHRGLLVFILIVVPLLIVAAIIEGILIAIEV